jgi:hypothetical protein
MNNQSLNSTLFCIKNQLPSINTNTKSMPGLIPQFHLQLKCNEIILPQILCLSSLKCMIFINPTKWRVKNNDLYFNCKYHDLPLNHTDNNQHLNSHCAWSTQTIQHNREYQCNCKGSNTLNLNIHNVGLLTNITR